MSSYEMSRDGLELMALPADLEDRLRDALDGPCGAAIARMVDQRISALIDWDGGVNDDGAWPGDWSAVDVVRAALAYDDD